MRRSSSVCLIICVLAEFISNSPGTGIQVCLLAVILDLSQPFRFHQPFLPHSPFLHLYSLERQVESISSSMSSL